jgi:hypothetical protein
LVSTERNEVLYYGAYGSLVVMGDGLTIGFFSTFVSGYRRYFNGLRDFLSTQPFAGQIQLIGKEDPGVTDGELFEVTFVDTGQMIHSKRVVKEEGIVHPNARQLSNLFKNIWMILHLCSHMPYHFGITEQ